jgi:hypothetical protein
VIPKNSVIGEFLCGWCLVPTAVIALWAVAVGVADIILAALARRGGTLSQVPDAVGGDGHVAGGGVPHEGTEAF